MPSLIGGALMNSPTEPDHHQQAGQVQPVAPGQQQRRAADLAVELAEGDQRTGERHRADQDADVDLQLVDGLLGARQRAEVSM
jgi:hypothetical protein